MKLAEAKNLVLGIILARQPEIARLLEVASISPDGDPGKFIINGKAARVIHHFDGWFVPISLGWFRGGYDPPIINKTSFHWYAFAIPKRSRYLTDHYFICDYLQMREWVLAFSARATAVNGAGSGAGLSASKGDHVLVGRSVGVLDSPRVAME